MSEDTQEDITPIDSVAPVYLNTAVVELGSDPIFEQDDLKQEAVQKLMTEFGFTEEMAKAVVGLP